MGAAWRSPKASEFGPVIAMIREVTALRLETCVTLEMLTADQARELKSARLDYYNHNLDASHEDYARIIATRTDRDRLDELQAVPHAGPVPAVKSVDPSNSHVRICGGFPVFRDIAPTQHFV